MKTNSLLALFVSMAAIQALGITQNLTGTSTQNSAHMYSDAKGLENTDKVVGERALADAKADLKASCQKEAKLWIGGSGKIDESKIKVAGPASCSNKETIVPNHSFARLEVRAEKDATKTAKAEKIDQINMTVMQYYKSQCGIEEVAKSASGQGQADPNSGAVQKACDEIRQKTGIKYFYRQCEMKVTADCEITQDDEAVRDAKTKGIDPAKKLEAVVAPKALQVGEGTKVVHGGIQFASPDAANVDIDIVKLEGNSISAKDEKRFFQVISFNRPNDGGYIKMFNTINGQQVDLGKQFTIEGAKAYNEFIFRMKIATKECPVRMSIDAVNMKIIAITNSCPLLSLAPSDNDAG